MGKKSVKTRRTKCLEKVLENTKELSYYCERYNTMSSTENLLQDSGDKSTNTVESGYYSERAEDDLTRLKHKEKASKKKTEHHRDVGLENKGFESDNEQVNRSGKHSMKVHRTSSENVARQLTTKPEQRDEKRRHSFAGQPSKDEIQTADVVSQKGSRHRRRSSSADEDLRRRACFNSMRLRRVSSSESSQLPPSEVDESVDDEVFYEDFAATDARERHPGLDYAKKIQSKGNHKAYSMGSLCDVVETENRKLEEYSKRLSYALEERAKLEEELKLLRRTASVATMPAEEKWKISSQIHFRNEKYNSERRLSTRTNEGNQFSLEQLQRIQYGQGSRKLPDVPRVISSKGDEFGEEISLESDKKVETLPQRKISEENPQQLEQKSKIDSFPLSDSGKERRERKTADLAADLWKKLLRGEKFHVEGETMVDKARETSLDGTTKTGYPKEATKSANPSYAKIGMTQRDSGRDIIGRLASGVDKKEKPLARSESESNLARTDAFRRNQRRPLRYKRRSISTEALAAETQPSTSTLNKSETNGPQQEKPEKLEGIRSTEAVSQNRSKWFDYMLPPGKRGNREDTASQNSPQNPRPSRQETSGAELSLSEKLRYYQDLQEQRYREENSFDLADAFMAAEDVEAEREYQRKAAGEAAMLRREASRLLYQAMNLERICDPNARVRHIFTPY